MKFYMLILGSIAPWLLGYAQGIGGKKKTLSEVLPKKKKEISTDILEPDHVPPFSEHSGKGLSIPGTSVYDVETIAGIGDTRKGDNLNGKGFTNGMGRTAAFNYPAGLVMNSEGHLLIVDAGNYSIRKIDKNNTVTTVAGNGTQGLQEGTGSDARFMLPVAITRLNEETFLIADKNASVIWKLQGNKLTPFAGSADNPYKRKHQDGVLAQAIFNEPVAIAVSSKNEIFISDAGNACIRKIANGTVTTFAGAPGESGDTDGWGTAARFSRLLGLVCDTADNLYVADGNLIRQISKEGQVTTWAGQKNKFDCKDGQGQQAVFNLIRQITISPSGNIYVTDSKDNGYDGMETVVRKITPDAKVVTVADGLTESQFKKLLFKMYGDQLTSGTYGFPVKDGPAVEAYFQHINGMYVDDNENIYFSDMGFHCIRKMTARKP